MTAVNEEKLHAFVGKMLDDLGAAAAAPTVRLGFKLGLFQTLREHGPMSAEALAERAGLAPRYVREWALAQAANGYAAFDPATESFGLTPEQALVFAVPDSPVYMEGAYEIFAATMESVPKLERAFHTGEGVQWGESAACLFCAVGAFFRPSYVNNLVQAWIPALDGAEARLHVGAKVADVGCGVGFSTLLMAKAYPNSRFVGFDFHEPSIAQARKHAEQHGLSDRVRFETAAAKEIAETGFDLITCFDCLHDMGDPRGCARRMREIMTDDGAWMVVEPIAADLPQDNMNPVGRLYYNSSTMICVPTSLAQEVGEALGAQAGEAKIAEIIRSGGFTRVRRATEGPFNMVLEAKA